MMEMERKVEEFNSNYDMEVLMEKNKEYRRRSRNKNDPSSTPEVMKTLKAVHACCVRFGRLKKKLKDLREDIKNLECGCMNFHRRDPQGEDSCATPYPLTFRRHPRNLLIKRRV